MRLVCVTAPCGRDNPLNTVHNDKTPIHITGPGRGGLLRGAPPVYPPDRLALVSGGHGAETWIRANTTTAALPDNPPATSTAGNLAVDHIPRCQGSCRGSVTVIVAGHRPVHWRSQYRPEPTTVSTASRNSRRSVLLEFASIPPQAPPAGAHTLSTMTRQKHYQTLGYCAIYI